MWNPEKSVPAVPEENGSTSLTTEDNNPYEINYDGIIENIKELNVIAGDGETKIEKTTSGARFKVRIVSYIRTCTYTYNTERSEGML